MFNFNIVDGKVYEGCTREECLTPVELVQYTEIENARYAEWLKARRKEREQNEKKGFVALLKAASAVLAASIMFATTACGTNSNFPAKGDDVDNLNVVGGNKIILTYGGETTAILEKVEKNIYTDGNFKYMMCDVSNCVYIDEKNKTNLYVDIDGKPYTYAVYGKEVDTQRILLRMIYPDNLETWEVAVIY